MSALIQSKNNEDIDEVLMSLVYMSNLKDMRTFATDLFTESELEALGRRWKAARMLHAGISYRKIERVTGMSSATIAKLAKIVANRGGGFNNLLSSM